MARWLLHFFLLSALAGCNAPATPLPTDKVKIDPTLTPIIISSPTTPPMGILTGRVTIGPLTPVIRLDQPTPITPAEMYTSRFINILNEDGKTLFIKVHFKPDGTYLVELPVGKYVVEYARSGLERAKDVPAVIWIEKDKITELDLEIDTGMR